MNRWLLTLGDFETTRGQVVEVCMHSPGDWQVRCVATYTPPASRQVQGKGLTGARLMGNTLWACHFNAIVRYDLEQGRWDTWLERDDFNDLHDLDLDVDAAGGLRRVVVANTGRDTILTFDASGSLRRARHLRPTSGALESSADDPYFPAESDRSPWQQKLRDRVHPNAVRFDPSGLLISRFLDRSVERITEAGHDGVSFAGLPHDLVPMGNEVWSTTTDGRVWASAPGSGHPPRPVLDTFATSGASGWCRGLAVDERWVLVGLTSITAMPRERWCDRALEPTRTQVLVYDRARLDCIEILDLSALGIRPKLFSIIPCQ